jgi:hypothetical protein
MADPRDVTDTFGRALAAKLRDRRQTPPLSPAHRRQREERDAERQHIEAERREREQEAES